MAVVLPFASATQTHGLLRPEHQAYLAARGVSPANAAAAGIESVSPSEAARRLGAATATPDGIAIPYPGVTPGYVRLRADVGDAKFLAPAGRPVPVYLPPQFVALEGGPLIVVEGPIKALGLAAQGFLAVGLGGTGTTLTTGVDRRLNDSWTVVSVSRRVVVLLLDSNRASNGNVARDEGRLAIALERGGASVWLAALPHETNGEAQGPDDFLVANGAAALTNVISACVPANPVERVGKLDSLQGAALDEALATLLCDLPFLLSIVERGEGVRALVEKKLKALGVTAKSFSAALNEARKRLRLAQTPHASTLAPEMPTYVEHGGKLCLIDGDERKHATVLCNFVAHVDRELVLDNGIEQTRAFEIRGKTDEDVELPSITVTPEAFAKEPWPVVSWGTNAIVAADRSAMAHVRVAIQVLSSPLHVRVFTHLGFAKAGDERVYLHAGGSIGAVEAEVRVGDDLARFTLPEAPVDIVGGIRLALRLRDVAGRKLGFLLIAVAFRAPLQSTLYMALVVWLHGKSGSFKTAISAILQAFFGDFDANNLPGSWSSTVTAIEELLFVAKDMLAVVDDFAPASADPNDPTRKVAAAIVRSIGNQKSRARARADLTLRPNRPPRALVLSTAEDEPSGQSVIARTFPVEMKREQVNLAALSELQAKRERLKHVMAAYVQYLIANDPGDHLAKRVVELREQVHLSGAHARLPDAVAHLTIGAEYFADFARSYGVLSEKEATEFKREALASILDLASGQTVATKEADPAQRFLTVLGSLLSQRRVLVVPRRAGSDLQADVAADNRFAIAQQEGGSPTPRERIGWCDAKYFYLDPDAAYRVVYEAMKAMGAPMALVQRTLWERLRDRGAIVTEGGHNTVKRVCGGVSQRVLLMPRSALDPEDGGDDGGGPGPAGSDFAPTNDDSDPGDEPPPRPSGGLAGAVDRSAAPTVAPSPAAPPTQPESGRSTRDSGSSADSGSSHGPHLSGFPINLPDLPDLPASIDRDHIGAKEIVTSESTTRREKNFSGRALSSLGSGEIGESGRPGGQPAPVAPLFEQKPREKALVLGRPSGATAVNSTGVIEGRFGEMPRGTGFVVESALDLGHALRLDHAPLGTLWDVGIAARLLDAGIEHPDYGLEATARRYKVAIPPASGPESPAARGALLLAVGDALQTKLAGDPKLAALVELESAAAVAVACTERAGVLVDLDGWKALVERHEHERGRLLQQLKGFGITKPRSEPSLSADLSRIFGRHFEKTGDALRECKGTPLAKAVSAFRRVDAFLNDLGPAVLRAATETRIIPSSISAPCAPPSSRSERART